MRIFPCGTDDDPDLGPFRRCNPGPAQAVELDEDGTFTIDVTVAAIAYFGGLDCRDPAAACHLEAVAAGRNRTVRTTARAGLPFDPDAAVPDRPAPQLTVSPTTDLDDVEIVRVHGSGFAPGSSVPVVMCQTGGYPDHCGFEVQAGPPADAHGEIDAELAVESSFEGAFFPGESGFVDCREAPGCSLFAFDRDRGDELTIPLSFGEPEPGPRTRYVDTVFDEVDVVSDVVYRETVDANGNPVQLKLDLYLPRGDTATRRPATLWMHGGWFRGGARADMGSTATWTARHGQVGVSIDYRNAPPRRHSATSTSPASTPTTTPRPPSSGCTTTPASTASTPTRSSPAASRPGR